MEPGQGVEIVTPRMQSGAEWCRVVQSVRGAAECMAPRISDAANILRGSVTKHLRGGVCSAPCGRGKLPTLYIVLCTLYIVHPPNCRRRRLHRLPPPCGRGQLPTLYIVHCTLYFVHFLSFFRFNNLQKMQKNV